MADDTSAVAVIDPAAGLVATRYRVVGMDCAHDAPEIEWAVRAVARVEAVKVSVATQMLTARVAGHAVLPTVELAVTRPGTAHRVLVVRQTEAALMGALSPRPSRGCSFTRPGSSWGMLCSTCATRAGEPRSAPSIRRSRVATMPSRARDALGAYLATIRSGVRWKQGTPGVGDRSEICCGVPACPETLEPGTLRHAATPQAAVYEAGPLE